MLNFNILKVAYVLNVWSWPSGENPGTSLVKIYHTWQFFFFEVFLIL